MDSPNTAEPEYSLQIPDYAMMVMLVDDQAMVGEAVRRLLADEPDMDFHYCADPREAVRQADVIKPTVILQDLVMPQMDGLDVVRLFRSNPGISNTPIIVLSTKEDAQVKSQAFAAGANDYLVKLPDKVELIARIRYHSKAYLNLVQRDEAYRALRESQQHLLDTNTALTALNQTLEETMRSRNKESEARQAVLLELQESQERFRQLAQNVPQVFWLTSPDGQEIFYVSPAYETIWGRPQQSLEQNPFDWAEAIYPEDREQVLTTFADKVMQGEYAQEFRILRADGTTLWIQDRCFPITNVSRKVSRIARITEDITQHKLAQAAILQAREEAERANQAKSEFLSRMSHELRTPLNAILGFSQLLQMEGLEDEQLESVEQILKGGNHLLQLINEVLDISRIEAGHLSLSLEPVPIGTVIQEVTELIAPLAAAANIQLHNPQLHRSLAHDPLAAAARQQNQTAGQHIQADRQRLKQVLLNLASNAVKYNRHGGSVTFSYAEVASGVLMDGILTSGVRTGGTVRSGDVVSEGTETPSPHPTRLRISIADTGPGLAQQDLVKLFMPFERLQAERSEVEGTGLGLALSKSLVEAMNGSIGVQSTLGYGSTFWVEFPIADSPLAQMGQSDFEELKAGLECSDEVKVLTVLYIEDNLSNLRLIERLISRRKGLELISAMQGRLGIELAREHQPALILLDLHLPDSNGDEVLRRLQADAATRGIPVVLLSADATPGQIERLRAAGAIDYLTKPLDVRKFLQVLDENCGKHRMRLHSEHPEHDR